MAGPGRVCRPCDWWDTLFLLGVCVCVPSRIVKRREKKAGGKERREDILGSAGRKTPTASAMRKKRGGETFKLFISIFIMSGHAKVTIYRFFFQAPSWCNRPRHVTRVYSSFCGVYTTRREKFDDNTRTISLSMLWQSRNCDEIKFNPIHSRAYVLQDGDMKIRGIRGKWVQVDNSIGNPRRLINVNDLIEFFIDKPALCQFEHVSICAHSNFDLPELPSFFFHAKTCRNNYLVIANSIRHTMILFLCW